MEEFKISAEELNKDVDDFLKGIEFEEVHAIEEYIKENEKM